MWLLPEEIVLGEFVLRRWSVEQAGLLWTAVTESFEHLHPWMPWAARPPALSEQVDYLTRCVVQWESGTTFAYGVFDLEATAVLGAVSLMDRIGPGGWEIGYWVHADWTGRGIITEASAALTRAAFELLGAQRVEIRCDEANTASSAVPQRLGFRLDRIDDLEPEAPAETGHMMIWIK
jgi:RimJ/RimL family protein N-acetyltransferase